MKRILIGTCGYEQRSIQFSRAEDIKAFDQVFIIDYLSDGVLSYDRNKAELLDILPIDRTSWVRSDCLNELLEVLGNSEGDRMSVEVDCSSMDRSALAKILSKVKANSENYTSLNILYFPQTFSNPTLSLEAVSRFGPISRQFSGSSRSSSERMCLIMGVGYEFGKAIGAQDYLEPDELYAFYPIGTDPMFQQAILKANSGFDFVGDPERVVAYTLHDPAALLDDLLALIDFKRRTHRVMLLPMGPKIFAALCLVIALRFHPDIRVWRFSTEDPSRSSVRDAYAAGDRIAFDVLRAMVPSKPNA